MTGWAGALALGLIAGAGLWWWLRPRGVLALALAGALLTGLAGYAVQGSPGLPDKATPPRAEAYRADTEFAEERGKLLENLGNVGAWLNFADALQRAGLTKYSVEAMTVATRAFPDSPDLWVGLGNALVVHGEGMVSPAAELAFKRAQQIAPDHPGPPYFFGLAWLQAGKPDQAIAVWQELRDRSPPDAPWLPELDRRLAAAKAMQAALQ